MRKAIHDLAYGGRLTHVWGRLGWQDIRRRYRRSVLGPFWITISMGLMVALLGALYGTLLEVADTDYIPHLTAGVVVWGLVGGMITDGCRAFISARNIIHQVRLPLSVHIYRVIWSNLIVFWHNAAIFALVALVYSISPGWTALLIVPALAVVCMNGAWMGLVLGLLAARYRDVPPVVESAVRIAFFLTPIIWMPELLAGRAVLLDFNPFHHALEIVRAPLLGRVPSLTSWLAVLGVTLVGWLVALLLFGRYRARVAYWV